jgi:K+-sensing histidine kinase KdpD
VPDSLLILTDKLIFLKVLRELLYNADQFTQSGSITLGCYQPDEASVCFSVTDTGQGIPEEYRSKLFSKFFKPNEFSEGLGLGLTLCQTAIEQMGGNIRLDETYTTGARFIITLPLR